MNGQRVLNGEGKIIGRLREIKAGGNSAMLYYDGSRPAKRVSKNDFELLGYKRAWVVDGSFHEKINVTIPETLKAEFTEFGGRWWVYIYRDGYKVGAYPATLEDAWQFDNASQFIKARIESFAQENGIEL
jgi:hypothetical protein